MANSFAESIEFEVGKDAFVFEKSVALQDKTIAKYQKVARIYFKETDENRDENIKKFKAKLRSISPRLVSNLPANEDEFLLKFLRAGGYDVDGGVTVLQNYTDMIKTAPKYFGAAFGGNVGSFKKVYDQRLNAVLPSRDKHGRRIYMFQMGNWNPDVLTFQDYYCSGYMFMEMISREEKTQMVGVTIIVDGANFGFKQARNFTLEDMRYSARTLQDNIPLWFRAIHVVNCPYLLHGVIRMVRPMMHERVRDAIIVHDSLDTLYEHVDRGILPKSLGGDTGEFSNEEAAEAVFESQDYFDQLKKYIYQD